MYYGLDWIYGVGVLRQEDERPLAYPAHFERKRYRDEWVDKSPSRTVCEQRVALWLMAEEIASNKVIPDYDLAWQIIQYVPAREICETYDQLMGEE